MVKVSVADGRLLVDPAVFAVVEEIAQSAGVALRDFWKRMDELVAKFGPRNKVRQKVDQSARAQACKPSPWAVWRWAVRQKTEWERQSLARSHYALRRAHAGWNCRRSVTRCVAVPGLAGTAGRARRDPGEARHLVPATCRSADRSGGVR